MTTDESYGFENRNSTRKEDQINSETMENKDSAINQHENSGSDTEEDYDIRHKRDESDAEQSDSDEDF
jgi:hypothetical protein